MLIPQLFPTCALSLRFRLILILRIMKFMIFLYESFQAKMCPIIFEFVLLAFRVFLWVPTYRISKPLVLRRRWTQNDTFDLILVISLAAVKGILGCFGKDRDYQCILSFTLL